ncbi:hypothetical protein WR25_03200 [Diploscapter pachys]|uniref:Uncharacterized protein n=1 Tax=Diploscapter pachys TaxID=2018661 RepID=A0A2A2KYV6_9BILA|nr:hypothetical protein WR25_03200 [Diploscapter pachys]
MPIGLILFQLFTFSIFNVSNGDIETVLNQLKDGITDFEGQPTESFDDYRMNRLATTLWNEIIEPGYGSLDAAVKHRHMRKRGIGDPHDDSPADIPEEFINDPLTKTMHSIAGICHATECWFNMTGIVYIHRIIEDSDFTIVIDVEKYTPKEVSVKIRNADEYGNTDVVLQTSYIKVRNEMAIVKIEKELLEKIKKKEVQYVVIETFIDVLNGGSVVVPVRGGIFAPYTWEYEGNPYGKKKPIYAVDGSGPNWPNDHINCRDLDVSQRDECCLRDKVRTYLGRMAKHITLYNGTSYDECCFPREYDDLRIVWKTREGEYRTAYVPNLIATSCTCG